MQTVVIYSEDKEDRIVLAGELSSHKALNINITETNRGALNTLTGGAVRCLVFGVSTFNIDAVKMTGRFRAANPGVGILNITNKAESSSISAVKEMKRTIVLERPYPIGEVVKLCLKLTRGEELFQRDHRRFATEQHAKVENMMNNLNFEGTIYNMSKSGAFIELKTGTVTDGDLLKISIQMLDKERVVHGQVVWTVPQSIISVKPGAGLRFMNADDFYNKVLERV